MRSGQARTHNCNDGYALANLHTLLKTCDMLATNTNAKDTHNTFSQPAREGTAQMPRTHTLSLLVGAKHRCQGHTHSCNLHVRPEAYQMLGTTPMPRTHTLTTCSSGQSTDAKDRHSHNLLVRAQPLGKSTEAKDRHSHNLLVKEKHRCQGHTLTQPPCEGKAPMPRTHTLTTSSLRHSTDAKDTHSHNLLVRAQHWAKDTHSHNLLVRAQHRCQGHTLSQPPRFGKAPGQGVGKAV